MRVHNKVLKKTFEICFVPSIDQVADVFTKPLSTTRFLQLKNKLKVDESPFCLTGACEDRNGSCHVMPLLTKFVITCNRFGQTRKSLDSPGTAVPFSLYSLCTHFKRTCKKQKIETRELCNFLDSFNRFSSSPNTNLTLTNRFKQRQVVGYFDTCDQDIVYQSIVI